MGDVVKHPSATMGSGLKASPDEMLELHKGRYERLVIVGFESGAVEPIISSTAGLFETNCLLDIAKLKLLLGDE